MVRICLILLAILTTPTAAFGGNGVTLAAVVAQTGIARDYGLPTLEGMRLAVRRINATGGLLGEPLTLIPIDNQSTPIGAKWAGEQAVQMGAHGIIGAAWSSLSLPLSQVCQRNRRPMISPVSTRPRVTREGDFVFRVCYTDDFQGRALAEFALGALNARTAAVLINRKEEYSQTLADFFILHFVHRGGQLIWDNYYNGTAVDFSGTLAGLAEAEPDVVFVPGYSRDSGLILRQARGLGVDATFLGGDGWDGPIDRYAGDALEGSYFSNHWTPGLDTVENRRFLEAHRQVHGDRPIPTFTPLGHDAVMVFAEAVRRAGGAEPEAVRTALAATRDFPGVTGRLTFNVHGDPDGKTASILTRRDGEWRRVWTLGPNDGPAGGWTPPFPAGGIAP
jgi:branched-chain amino acid transport system substrate-binding protein